METQQTMPLENKRLAIPMIFKPQQQKELIQKAVDNLLTQYQDPRAKKRFESITNFEDSGTISSEIFLENIKSGSFHTRLLHTTGGISLTQNCYTSTMKDVWTELRINRGMSEAAVEKELDYYNFNEIQVNPLQTAAKFYSTLINTLTHRMTDGNNFIIDSATKFFLMKHMTGVPERNVYLSNQISILAQLNEIRAMTRPPQHVYDTYEANDLDAFNWSVLPDKLFCKRFKKEEKGVVELLNEMY